MLGCLRKEFVNFESFCRLNANATIKFNKKKSHLLACRKGPEHLKKTACLPYTGRYHPKIIFFVTLDLRHSWAIQPFPRLLHSIAGDCWINIIMGSVRRDPELHPEELVAHSLHPWTRTSWALHFLGLPCFCFVGPERKIAPFHYLQV